MTDDGVQPPPHARSEALTVSDRNGVMSGRSTERVSAPQDFMAGSPVRVAWNTRKVTIIPGAA